MIKEIIKCACGCGQEILEYSKWGYKRKYIHGHNGRGENNCNYRKELRLHTNEIISLYLDKKLSMENISKKFNCSIMPIIYILRDNKIKIRKQLDLPKDEIINLYINKKLSMDNIGKIYFCSEIAIKRVLKENNIKIRSAGESLKQSGVLKGENNYRYRKDLEQYTQEIADLYINEKVTMKDLGKRFNCSTNLIKRILKENNIKIRSNSESNKGKHNSPKTEFKKGMILYNKLKLPEQEIIGLYVNEKLNLNEIGRLYNCSGVAIKSILLYNYIKLRTHGESMRILYGTNKIIHHSKGKTKENYEPLKRVSMSKIGEKNPNWQGKLLKSQEYLEKYREGMARRPTRPELLLNNLLQNHFPNEWKYVGDFRFWIEGRNPDFINCNGQKKIIELFGDFWHSDKILLKKKGITKEQNIHNTIEHYSKYGFDTLIIFEKELKDINKTLERIKEFNGG